MALNQLADGVWEYGQTLRVPGGVKLPARTTVVRDRDGGILLYGPLPVEEVDADAIDALGEVRTILGPNKYHHMYLRQAKERWPKARLLGAPGLPEKRSNLSFDGVAEDGFVAPGLELRALRGVPMFGEVVLVHLGSRSLVCADFAFRIQEASGISKLAFKMMGDYGDTLKRSRLWRLGIRDREAYRASVEALLEADFDNVIMAHGDPVFGGAKAQLRSAHLG